jgi:hypothetical protein
MSARSKAKSTSPSSPPSPKGPAAITPEDVAGIFRQATEMAERNVAQSRAFLADCVAKGATFDRIAESQSLENGVRYQAELDVWGKVAEIHRSRQHAGRFAGSPEGERSVLAFTLKAIDDRIHSGAIMSEWVKFSGNPFANAAALIYHTGSIRAWAEARRMVAGLMDESKYAIVEAD